VSGEDDPRVGEVSEEVSGLLSYTEGEGVIVKADTLGSLEAAIRLLSGAGVRVGRVGIGAVSRKDLLECTAMRERCRHSAVVLAFNVRVPKDVEAYAKDCRIPIFTESVIYLLVEKFFKWRDNEEEQEKRDVFGKLQPIGSVRALPGCCFRASKPAVFGVKIEGGKIRPGALLVDENGKEVGRIRNIQHDKESLQEACSGMEVAVSVEDAYYGKDIVEGKRMYTYVPKHEADVYLEKYSKLLSSDEVSLLTHIMRITKQKLV